jgi:uncharacterized protein (DUF3084 family)
MPAMLIYGGLISYVDVPLVDKVGEIHTVIFKLPSHTTHVVQLMHLGVVRPLKLKWDKERIK